LLSSTYRSPFFSSPPFNSFQLPVHIPLLLRLSILFLPSLYSFFSFPVYSFFSTYSAPTKATLWVDTKIWQCCQRPKYKRGEGVGVGWILSPYLCWKIVQFSLLYSPPIPTRSEFFAFMKPVRFSPYSQKINLYIYWTYFFCMYFYTGPTMYIFM
jgi:hypothetical protein